MYTSMAIGALVGVLYSIIAWDWEPEPYIVGLIPAVIISGCLSVGASMLGAP